jgi:hypothetical protein
VITFPAVCGFVMLAWVLVAVKLTARRKERRAKALSEVRQGLWGDEARESGNRFVFISIPGWEQRLEIQKPVSRPSEA